MTVSWADWRQADFGWDLALSNWLASWRGILAGDFYEGDLGGRVEMGEGRTRRPAGQPASHNPQ